MIDSRHLAIRWTIGTVSPRGFEALRFSIWGAWRLFGQAAAYVVCVNSMPLARARELTGTVPEAVLWRDSTHEIPEFIRARLDGRLADGVGWKFAPLRLYPDRYELALDNDCILWALPEAIRTWSDPENQDRCVFAEDVRSCLGQFQELCGPVARNSGIRGLPPSFDLEREMREIFAEHPIVLGSETDEQGLQTYLVSRKSEPLIVRADEVTICSPFWPHVSELGRCGAHFVGLNSHHLPWNYYDRPADGLLQEHWEKCKPVLREKVGLEPDS